MQKTYTDRIFELAKLSKQVIAVPFALSFRYCNNNCKFCYLQPNMRKIPLSLDECRQLKDNFINWLRDNIDRFEPDVSFLVELIGGELFIMNKDYYQLYYDTIKEAKEITDKHNVEFHTDMISNFLLSKEHLNDFLDLYKKLSDLGLEVDIATSFDLWGRFKSDSAIDTWITNLEEVSYNIKKPITIEVILSKPSLEEYLNNPNSRLSVMLDGLLSMPDDFNIVFNDYVPNKEENIQYVPSNELIVEFYKKLVDKYYGKIPALDFLQYKDLSQDEYRSCAYKEECCGPAFGLESTLFDTKLDLEEYGIYKLYCAEIGLVAPWANGQYKERKDLYRVDIPEDEWICCKYPERVKYYFDNVLGCGTCKYKERCHKAKRQGCYATHNFKWKEDKCWVKEIFKYVENYNVLQQ